MKSRIYLLFGVLFSVLFVLLACCHEIEYDSLDEYKEEITQAEIGYSDFEIDHPKYFLPSLTYLDDYAYLEGNYYFYENSAFCDFCEHKSTPDRTLITLKYSEDEYLEAKECVLNNIPQYLDYLYAYNDYKFYFNKNFMDRFEGGYQIQTPEWFTMVCYNNENHTICFLGFHQSYPKLDEKFLNDLDNNWKAFIDTYYGEYYDFSK